MRLPSTPHSLHTAERQRKYLNEEELQRFLIMAHEAGDTDPTLKTLCELLVYTGCRISEALALTTDQFDLTNGTVSIYSLKKRGRLHVRELHLPQRIIHALNATHQIERQQLYGITERLWSISRFTAWRKIKAVMTAAKISGPQATPHGLRHTFGVQAIRRGIQVHDLQELMGHASLATTAIYAKIVGPERRQVIAKLWFEGDDDPQPPAPVPNYQKTASENATVICFITAKQRLRW